MDRHLHATSQHHPWHLQSVMSSVNNRTDDLCDPEYLEWELEQVQEVLKSNGYQVNGRRKQRKQDGSIQK